MTKIYITPQKDLTKYTCPHCNTVSQVEKDEHKFKSDLYGEMEHIFYKNIVTIHRCLCCGRKIIWIDDKYIYPDNISEEPNPDMPLSVKQLYRDAALISNKSPRAACALLRLAIDRLCNELGETDRDINNNISALVQKGLPQTIQQALDIVRVVGNKAVHPGQIDIDVDDKDTALELMSILNIIVTFMISNPQKIQSLYEKLPKSVKNSIIKREK